MLDTEFKKLVLGHWKKHGRHDMPWRRTTDPYRILVSEVMLQQTQVDRVVPFYRSFLAAFPTFRALSRAPVARVLKAWQGLGYNRRALMLRRLAQAAVADHGGALPDDYGKLVSLPGIGPYTAGAVCAFAFNKPHPVIETNIRRVYLHHFFPGRRQVHDRDILPFVIRHLSFDIPVRHWYWALMDYGATLAKSVPNPNRRSKQYARQSAFEGSVRQLRGRILRLLLEHGQLKIARLARLTGDVRTPAVLAALVDEGMARRRGMVVECK